MKCLIFPNHSRTKTTFLPSTPIHHEPIHTRKIPLILTRLWILLSWLICPASFCLKNKIIVRPPTTPTERRMTSLGGVISKFMGEYDSKTPKRLKIVDAYLFYILLTGIIQFVYCCLVGTFPFNSFLSGFISSVASFVLAGESYHTHSPPNFTIIMMLKVKICKNIFVYSLSSDSSQPGE